MLSLWSHRALKRGGGERYTARRASCPYRRSHTSYGRSSSERNQARAVRSDKHARERAKDRQLFLNPSSPHPIFYRIIIQVIRPVQIISHCMQTSSDVCKYKV
ncbi:hypothetical protein JG687_00018026 [Phytophthora cactorum]|uniref:Uncharacterized protein n=1 Tax=Phytophthora cactorum TaxID=29920 RepID=A0A8T1TLT0_9STRA|nr:hypothetical protein JG687_00018026 [Phytophthora cactorum]